MSLSKNNTKLITSLQQKKYRQKHNLFVAEGIKVVQELLNSSLNCRALFTTDADLEWASNIAVSLISEADLKKVSSLKSPNKVLALFEIPEAPTSVSNDLTVVLDGINDPGNLGTIIRLCDWFGVGQLLCSKNTVDCYNSKVIQATMGSITRVNIQYTDLVPFLESTAQPVYIADMDGTNVYTAELPTNGVLVMGNEANGVSDAVRTCVDRVLSIPRFGSLQKTESLNVATATAILLSEFRRGLK